MLSIINGPVVMIPILLQGSVNLSLFPL
jgi:hypothetical protein